jgi:hypothetical protein
MASKVFVFDSAINSRSVLITHERRVGFLAMMLPRRIQPRRRGVGNSWDRPALVFGALPNAIAVSCLIALEREGIGRCLARHSSMPATYSSETLIWIVMVSEIERPQGHDGASRGSLHKSPITEWGRETKPAGSSPAGFISGIDESRMVRQRRITFVHKGIGPLPPKVSIHQCRLPAVRSGAACHFVKRIRHAQNSD